MKFSYYIKFHGARTAFCWVIEGTMTSAGHRLHTSDGHRTIFGNLNRTILTGGRASYDVWKEQGTFENLFTNHPMPVRAPADVLWVELPPVRSDVYLQRYILNLYRYVTCEDQKLKFNYMYICFAWGAKDEKHATKKCYSNVCNLEQELFSHPSLSESASVFLI